LKKIFLKKSEYYSNKRIYDSIHYEFFNQRALNSVTRSQSIEDFCLLPQILNDKEQALVFETGVCNLLELRNLRNFRFTSGQLTHIFS
jgi:hypothetical protein